MTDKPLLDRLLLLINELAGGNKKRFAEMLDISPSNINSWLNEGYLPKTEHLSNIHDKLHISIDWLLTGKGERYIKPASKEYSFKDSEHRHSYVMEDIAQYGYDEDIKKYTHKLIHIFQDKNDDIVNAIKRTIDAFLDAPNKTKAKKTASNK